MADFSALKTAIQANIRTNGNEEITGAILQDILLSMVTTMGDGAINGLVTALQAEVVARQNAVGGEAEARQQADSALSGRIDGVANYITAINTKLAEGYIYAGIATPSADPSTPAGKVFYIALQAGTYTNFSSLAVTQGITILKYNGTAWSQEQLVAIDDVPTAGSNNLVKSGGVFANIGAFDISEYNKSGSTLATYADLTAALAALPSDFQKGGMSIKFVQSSDNKYVQYRLMNQNWSTTVTDWQGVDDEPTAGSGNLVNSGGVFKVTDKISEINKIESYSDTQDEYLEIKSNNDEEILKITSTESYGEHGLLFDIRNNNNNSLISAYNSSDSTILRIDNKYLITKREFIVDKNGNGTHTSLIRAIIDAEKHMDSIVRVNEGVYNFIDELMDYYGSDYFSDAQINNSTIVEGGKGRGIYLKNRIKLIFSSKSKVIYHYTGDYQLAQTWVSPFNSGEHGFYIENLTLECSNCRYAFHDERGESTEPYRNEFINCRMTFDNGMNPYVARQCIGGGLGENGEIIIRDSYFYSVHPNWASEYFKKVISYHNSSHSNAKSTIVITGCNIASPGGSIVITWYGTSTEKTKALISNNWVGQPVSKEAETQDATIDNIDLYEFNNINRNEVLNN